MQAKRPAFLSFSHQDRHQREEQVEVVEVEARPRGSLSLMSSFKCCCCCCCPLAVLVVHVGPKLSPSLDNFFLGSRHVIRTTFLDFGFHCSTKMAKKVSPGFTECAHILPAWLNVIASAAQQNSQILQKLFRDMTINAAVSLSLSLSLVLSLWERPPPLRPRDCICARARKGPKRRACPRMHYLAWISELWHRYWMVELPN